MAIKVLFLFTHPIQGASSRYRIYQYLPFLKKANIQYHAEPFVSESFYKILYKKGYWFKKALFTSLGLMKRIRALWQIPFCDIIFIHLESSPFPILILERFAKLFKKPIIYDFDDAIFLRRKYATHRWRQWVGTHKVPPKLISMSHQVMVGNPYLKKYASQHTHPEKILVFPTTIDTQKFPLKKSKNAIPIIGWIGMHTTFPYFENLLDIFPEIAKKHSFILKIIGAPKKISIPNVSIVQKDWHLSEEIDDFLSLDIGLYPLFDPEWDVGKAGFKALLYMAAQVPCIASAVGRNKEIIQDGDNGFLVTSKKEWIEKTILLLESEETRKRLIKKGRETVEAHFSVEPYAKTLVQTFQTLVTK